MTVHTGQQLRFDDGTDHGPTLIVGKIYLNPEGDSFAGLRLQPFADVTWDDDSTQHISLASLAGSAYTDTGI